MSEEIPSEQADKAQELLSFNPRMLKKLKRDIITHLGHGRVKVELTEEQVELAIEESISLLVPYFAHESSTYYLMRTSPNQVEYSLPKGVHIVQDVIYNPSESILNSTIGFNRIYALESYGDAATFHMMLANVKTAQRVYDKVDSWELVNGNKIRIYPTPTDEVNLILRVIGDITKASSDQWTWIKKYAQGEAMVILGRIRGKFGSVPSSQGQVSWDGDAMKSEGEELKARTLEEVKLRNPVFALTVG